MKTKDLEKLLAFMDEHGLQELELSRLFYRIRIKKCSGLENERVYEISSGKAGNVRVVEAERKEEADDRYHKILSPMVGTFYRSPSPGAEPFVNEGDTVKKGQVLCIIEAMKVMNEIESDVSGRVVKILVENGKPAEYNQPLFLIEAEI